jgi:hypothetical protein
MIRRIRQPQRLRPGGRNGQNARTRKRGWAVAAKLGAVGHLPANAADVAQGFIQIVHGDLALYCKVNQASAIVNWDGKRRRGQVPLPVN